MSYHTILKTSKDYYEALRSARKIASNMTETIELYVKQEYECNITYVNDTYMDDNCTSAMPKSVEVFPYR